MLSLYPHRPVCVAGGVEVGVSASIVSRGQKGRVEGDIRNAPRFTHSKSGSRHWSGIQWVRKIKSKQGSRFHDIRVKYHLAVEAVLFLQLELPCCLSCLGRS